MEPLDQLTESEAASALLERRALRESLVKWAEFVTRDKGLVPAKHHRLMLDYIQRAIDGKLIHPDTHLPCRKLMILMPPGSAKSTYTSVIAPAWAIQRLHYFYTKDNPSIIPDIRILGCSCTQDLIEFFSGECRNTINEYSKVLGYNLRADSRSVQKWATDNGATYICGGVGGSLSGRRGDLAIIDDYIGNEEDANSKTVRDKQWNWYMGDFRPRLKPNATQIIVANRRHEEDIVGKLLETEPEKWVVIKIPFFAKENDVLGRQPGEPLWPEWYTPDQVAEVRSLPARTRAGLYDQEPAPDEGSYFLRDYCVTYKRDEYEQLLQLHPRIYAAGDWAVSEEKGSCKTCFGPAALDHRGFLYILPDLFWKIAGPDKVVPAFVQMLKNRNPLVTWSEKGHISKAWGPFLKEMMVNEEVFAYVKEVTPSNDKEVRAQSIRGRMSMHLVKFPEFADWWPAALHQLLTFPGGKEDDFVDFIAHLGLGLSGMARPTSPRNTPTPTDINTPQRLDLKWMKKSDRMSKRELQPLYGGR